MRWVEGSGSIWKAGARALDRAALRGDARVDVCVVGAGIAGLTTAYLCAREGRRVLVLDDKGVAAGQTAQTTAHLASALDDRFVELERLHGPDGSRAAYRSHAAAIDRIEAIAAEERIDCDFERLPGWLVLAEGDDRETLVRELEAAQRAGAQVELLEAHPLATLRDRPCLRFDEQAQVHPLAYAEGLARAIEARGGRVHGGTRVVEVEGGDVPFVRTASGARVRAGAVVVATNSPVSLRFAIHSKQAPWRTFAIAAPVPAGAVPRALYWDTEDPYHYVRLQTLRLADGTATDLLVVGGEDHRTGEANDADARFARLEAWARPRFPEMGGVCARWSGQVLEPFDGLAFIGRSPGQPNVYVATGDSGHGMTHGTIAGMLITDLVAGRASPWEALYDPARKTVRAAGEYARDNLAVLKRLGGWLREEHEESTARLEPGHGAVVGRGTQKRAVYRDEGGVLHERSAACTHLGCPVAWNDEERSFDCACHGSRFAPTGEVLCGPATADLAPIDRGKKRAA